MQRNTYKYVYGQLSTSVAASKVRMRRQWPEQRTAKVFQSIQNTLRIVFRQPEIGQQHRGEESRQSLLRGCRRQDNKTKICDAVIDRVPNAGCRDPFHFAHISYRVQKEQQVWEWVMMSRLGVAVGVNTDVWERGSGCTGNEGTLSWSWALREGDMC